LKSTLTQKSKEVHQLSKSFSKLIDQIETNYNRQFSTEQLEFLLQFSCPSCGHKMKISEKKMVRINCPNCSYSFLVDTGSAKLYPKWKLINRRIKRLFEPITRLTDFLFN
jgi:transposase-like protein